MPENIVEWKPRPRDRVFIRLSGGRFFTVPASETNPLREGATLSDEEIEKLSRIDQYVRGREKAVRLLAIRPRSRREITKALDAMSLVPSIRDGVLVELEELGLVDDARFARDFVRSQVDLRRLGPHRLRFDLKRKGVSASLIDAALAAELDDDRQVTAAREIVRKKLGSATPDEGDIRRLAAQLKRKGLDYGIINRVLYDALRRSGRDVIDEEIPDD
jgi:regulatory protein